MSSEPQAPPSGSEPPSPSLPPSPSTSPIAPQSAVEPPVTLPQPDFEESVVEVVMESTDSGISTEKSNSGSSDVNMLSIEDVVKSGSGPSSSSNFTMQEKPNNKPRTFKLPKPNRNYRSRSNPSVDSDDDISIDSDDYSREETLASNNSSEDNENLFENNISDSSSMDDDDDDDDLVMWSDGCARNELSNDELETPAVLLKRKPNYQWNPVKEIINRELGSISRPGVVAKTDVMFEQRFYGSLRTVERLELMYKLNKHKGCVNSINFHPEGHLLASGSDDLNIIIWDWTTNAFRKVVRTDHKSNIFQSRFLHLNTTSQIDIVSCGRDGQVLLTQVLTGGGAPIKRRLAEHAKSAHKLYTNSLEPHIVVSAGEDARVIVSDVRQEKANRSLTIKDNGVKMPLYSVSCHPLNTHEMCVAGRGRRVLVFDRRKMNAKPLKSFCPEFFRNPTVNNGRRRVRTSILAYITCAVYNHNGSEILASYNDDDIYLYDTTTDCESANSGHGFSNYYCGHRNSETFKGVSFFGPHSEFVVSGSDCGNIFIWDKKTEAIVQWMMGDEAGVVNCIESHPRFPVLATSGLDRDVKIWVPSYEKNPEMIGLKETVMKNISERYDRPLFNFLPRVFDIFGAEESDTNSDEERPEDPGCAAF